MRAATIACLLSLGGLTACGGPAAPTWLRLATLEGEAPLATDSLTTSAGRTFTRGNGEERSWLETELVRADWEAGERSGAWTVERPLLELGRAPDGTAPVQLAAEGETFRDWSTQWLFETTGELPPGAFELSPGGLELQLEPGREPPPSVTLRVSALHGRQEDGRWLVAGRRFSGEGFAVWPGARLERSLRIPADSALRFATCAEAAEPAPTDEPLTFRIRLDDSIVFEHEQPITAAGTTAWHAVPLPSGGVQNATLRFEVDGPLAFTSFLSPVVGPREIGEHGARPWDAERPDVVVFLADTFRADNMDAFGGELGLTPNLDELAARSRRFSRAYSVSTSTLSAHASLFSGLYPRQTGLVGFATIVPSSLDTLAERLARHGYRTAAVTEKGFVSQFAGMSQGFEFFDEERDHIDTTVARALDTVGGDDGRPLFLFVHSYHAHTPYQVSDETRAELADVLEIEGTQTRWNVELARVRQGAGLDSPRGRRTLAALRNLYLGGVRDLDKGFGVLARGLTEAGLIGPGYFFFTSDHGEAFGEHGEIFHSGRVFEEQVRVPLFLFGPGVTAADVTHPASLIDLAPTIAELTGLAHDPTWRGGSLLTLAEDRPLFLYQCTNSQLLSAAAMVAGDHKVLGTEDALGSGEIRAAFDLGTDPGETDDVHASGAAWPKELVERLGPSFEVTLEPLFEAEATALDGGQLEDLRGLGYIGDEE